MVDRKSLSHKTVKFGGSSLANAEQFKKVKNIVTEERERRFVVPSAPGKRFSSDVKVTDMLYSCYDAVSEGADSHAEWEPIAKRFDGIIADLGLDLSLESEYETILANFRRNAGRDYAASRGEYLSGIILAKYLGYTFVDASEVVQFRDNGALDADMTNALLATRLLKLGGAVIPGFYGALPDGRVRTFSRGGSDFTGSLVAKATQSAIYENWTDVSGFLMADPRIVEDPQIIDVITYTELRELSYMGATVLHESAIFPVRDAKIPINIRNTNAPEARGTMIVPNNHADAREAKRVVTGIAGRKNFSVISLEKDEMNCEIGFLRRILTVLEAFELNFEHIPTGIDTLSVILNTDELKRCPEVVDRLVEVARPNGIEVEDRLALVAVVGEGMKGKRGVVARIFAALAHSNINVRMIDQGSSEMNVIIGVNADDFDKSIRVIYDMIVLPEL